MLVSSGHTKQTTSNVDYRLGRVSIQRVDSESARHTNHGSGDQRGRVAAYDIIIPEKTAISFCQDDRSGEVRHGAYLLLKSDRFYELSSHDRLSHWRITMPAADMRSRLSSIDDHLGMRFDQDSRMAELLHGLVYMIVRTFRDENPPNAEAFAT